MMNIKKIKRYIILIIIIFVVSLGAGFFISVNQNLEIKDLEVVVENAANGNFYLMGAGSEDTRVMKVNASGKIVDRNIMKVSSLLKNDLVEFEGSAIEGNEDYIYCVKRWIDDTTMQFFRRDIVRLDAKDLSSEPVVLCSYKDDSGSLPRVTGLIENNGFLYVSLIEQTGEKAFVDMISLSKSEEDEDYKVKRIINIDSPSNDKFSNTLYNLNGNLVALTQGGRVYLCDQAYDFRLIYPESIEDNNRATLISVGRLDNNIYIYNQDNQDFNIYNNNNLSDIKSENLFVGQEKFINQTFFSKKQVPLYFNFDLENNTKIVLTTTKDSKNDDCKIIRQTEDGKITTYSNIKYNKNILILEVINKALYIFSIGICCWLVIVFIFSVIKKGRKIVYKFMLVVIPILATAFTVLCYIQANNNRQVIFDLKLAGAMTVNHLAMNNIDSNLVRELRDNENAYWDGTYQKVYQDIQMSANHFSDISKDVLSENKVAGIDKNYISNDVFLVKDKKIYTGVSDRTGFMLPMGTEYFEGTEALFETLRKTSEPQQGSIISRTYSAGVYISPIINNGEIVGILSTTFDVYTITKFISDSIMIFIRVAILLLIAILLPIFIMFSIVLKPLRELEKAVAQLAQGNYSIRLIETGNDEFSYIRSIFNKMCDQLSGSIYRVNNISNSYFRFVPRHMFGILDKKDILDVKLGDKKNMQCVLVTHKLYNFDEIEKSISDNGGDSLSNIIKFVDKYFNILHTNLKNRNGSLLSNELNVSKIESIFLGGERQAVDYSIDVMKKLFLSEQLNNLVKLDTSMIIYKANILYGIIGEEKRSLPFVVSLDKEEMNDILLDFRSSGARVIITEDIKQALTNWPELSLRYIGYSLVNNNKKNISMYEVLNCCDLLERQQKESTLEIFKEAIDLFYKKEFYLARNLFSDVVDKSPSDNIARWYLFLSDKYNNKNIKNYRLELYGDKDFNN
ncbi:MAG: hypothetical protein J6C55_01705 [Oscillospiraceae bacterium]|nr:hypothetical protein [Oscillospiraceae bacterium]